MRWRLIAHAFLLIGMVSLATCRRSPPPTMAGLAPSQNARLARVLGTPSGDWFVDSVRTPGLDDIGVLPRPDWVYFHNGRHLDTGLWEVTVLGFLPASHVPPYFVLQGRECTECDAYTLDIYIRSPLDPPVSHFERVKGAFLAPGTIRGYRSLAGEWQDSVIAETRVFLGKCLVDTSDNLVVFEHFRSDSSWHSEKRMAAIVADSLAVIRDSTLSILSVLARVGVLGCHELPRFTQRGPE